MKIKDLRGVLEAELKDIWSAETQLIEALPKVIKAVSSPELKKGISDHLNETKQQKTRLEQISKILEISLEGVTCKAMKGLLAEGDEEMHEKVSDLTLRDIFIIGSAKRIEHYEMAAYESAIAIAEHLGESEVAELLSETLAEERGADQLLSSVCDDSLLPSFEGDEERKTKESKSNGAAIPQKKGSQPGGSRAPVVR